jgi:hypothetical protein
MIGSGCCFWLAKAANAHTQALMVRLEGVMETPEEVAVMRRLVERGLSRRRTATELGIWLHMVSHHIY